MKKYQTIFLLPRMTLIITNIFVLISVIRGDFPFKTKDITNNSGNDYRVSKNAISHFSEKNMNVCISN